MSVFADSGRWPSRVSCSFWSDYHLLTFRPLLCSVSLWSAQKSQKARIRISLWYHPHSESWVASGLTGWLGHCYGWCAPAELKLPSKVRAECVYFYCLSATRSELTRLRVFTIKLKLCNYSSGPGREKREKRAVSGSSILIMFLWIKTQKTKITGCDRYAGMTFVRH